MDVNVRQNQAIDQTRKFIGHEHNARRDEGMKMPKPRMF